MSSSVLKLRITGAPGAYKVSAQFGDRVEEGDLGTLPENFRERLQPLQTSILRTTEALRNRLAAGVQHPPINHPPPASQTFAEFQEPALPPVRGAVLNFVTGADVKTIQEIGTKLFDCLFQQDVYSLYKSTLDAAHETTV
jgi:hypothetical protein